MYVQMIETLAGADHIFDRNQIYEVDMATGVLWVERGLAFHTITPPPFVERFHALLEVGAGMPCLFLPHLGEFGHKVMTGIRLFHWHKSTFKVVCCRRTERVLYPDADGFFHDWEEPANLKDSERGGSQKSPPSMWPDIVKRWPAFIPIEQGGLTPSQELIALRPRERIPFRPRIRNLPRVDVLLGVRYREFCREKNFPIDRWQRLADALSNAGKTFAVAGARPYTLDLPGQAFNTADYDTDASIEAMRGSRLFLGTDTGVSHLAATVGCRMGVIREEFFGRDFIPRMEEVNVGRVKRIQGYWDNPERIAAIALDMLATAAWER